MFYFVHNFENYGSWIVCQKGKRKQVNSLAECYSKNEIIFVLHCKICLNSVFKVALSVSLKYQTIFQISLLASYHFILHPYCIHTCCSFMCLVLLLHVAMWYDQVYIAMLTSCMMCYRSRIFVWYYWIYSMYL